jgi:hypothetical protein
LPDLSLANRRGVLSKQRDRCAYCDARLTASKAVVFADADRGRAACTDCAFLRGGRSHEEHVSALREYGFLTCGE